MSKDLQHASELIEQYDECNHPLLSRVKNAIIEQINDAHAKLVREVDLGDLLLNNDDKLLKYVKKWLEKYGYRVIYNQHKKEIFVTW